MKMNLKLASFEHFFLPTNVDFLQLNIYQILSTAEPCCVQSCVFFFILFAVMYLQLPDYGGSIAITFVSVSCFIGSSHSLLYDTWDQAVKKLKFTYRGRNTTIVRHLATAIIRWHDMLRLLL